MRPAMHWAEITSGQHSADEKDLQRDLLGSRLLLLGDKLLGGRLLEGRLLGDRLLLLVRDTSCIVANDQIHGRAVLQLVRPESVARFGRATIMAEEQLLTKVREARPLLKPLLSQIDGPRLLRKDDDPLAHDRLHEDVNRDVVREEPHHAQLDLRAVDVHADEFAAADAPETRPRARSLPTMTADGTPTLFALDVLTPVEHPIF